MKKTMRQFCISVTFLSMIERFCFCLFSLGLIERFDGKNWTTLGKTLSVATYAHCAVGIR